MGVVYRIALHCIALHCIALHCIASHVTHARIGVRSGFLRELHCESRPPPSQLWVPRQPASGWFCCFCSFCGFQIHCSTYTHTHTYTYTHTHTYTAVNMTVARSFSCSCILVLVSLGLFRVLTACVRGMCAQPAERTICTPAPPPCH
jgi:hypothetical protein